jgi:hypothetical protein
MKRVFVVALAAALLCLPACSSGSSDGGGSTASPEDIVTVRVTNTTGDLITVSYTFARSGAAHLGTVPRGGENVEFSFPWEPGRLEFIIEQPRGVVTSNGVSSRRGDTFDLQVSSRQARATRLSEPSG